MLKHSPLIKMPRTNALAGASFINKFKTKL
jgi:hypothetical protein